MPGPQLHAPAVPGSEADSEGSEGLRQWEQLPVRGGRAVGGCSDERLSKTLSSILRHSSKGRISIDLDGFAPLSQVMALVPGRTFAEIREVVRTSAKGGRSRFELVELQDRSYMIRATHGHTFSGVRPGAAPACAPLLRRHPSQPEPERSSTGGEPSHGRPAWAPRVDPAAGANAADAGAGTALPPPRAGGQEVENQALRAENERLRQHQPACPSASSPSMPLRQQQGRTLPLVPVVEPFEGPRFGEEYLELQRDDMVRRLPHPDADASWAFARLEREGWMPEELLHVSEREAACGGAAPAGPSQGPAAAGPAPAGGARWTQCSSSGQLSWRNEATGEMRVGPPPVEEVAEF